MRRLLTLSEVSSQTGIPEGTWRYWRHLGQGPNWIKIGRRLRVDEGQLKAWLDAQMGNNPAA